MLHRNSIRKHGRDNIARTATGCGSPSTKGKACRGRALPVMLMLAGWLALVGTPGKAAADEKETPPPRVHVGTLELGRRVFEQNCAICHGPLGDGRISSVFSPCAGAIFLVDRGVSLYVTGVCAHFDGPITGWSKSTT